MYINQKQKFHTVKYLFVIISKYASESFSSKKLTILTKYKLLIDLISYKIAFTMFVEFFKKS